MFNFCFKSYNKIDKKNSRLQKIFLIFSNKMLINIFLFKLFLKNYICNSFAFINL